MPRSATGSRYAIQPLAGAVSFDGSTAYVSTSGNAGSALWPSAALTVALWVRPSVLPAPSGGVVGLLDKFSSGSGWRLDLYCPSQTQQILFQSGAADITPNVQLPLGQWSHVCGVVVGTTGTVYGNGAAIGSGTVGAVANNSSVNLHAGSGQGSQFLSGVLADVRVYSVALSAAQVQAICQRGLCGLEQPATMVLWWPSQEGSGSSLHDATGNGFTGGFNGSAGWSTQGPFPARVAVS